MPRYELCVILKTLQRPDTAAALRRTAETLFERGAVVRNLENLGHRRLPYRISKHSARHTHGAYFSFHFYASPSIVSGLLEHLGRDIDVLRPTVLKTDPEQSVLPPGKCCDLSSGVKAAASR